MADGSLVIVAYNRLSPELEIVRSLAHLEPESHDAAGHSARRFLRKFVVMSEQEDDEDGGSGGGSFTKVAIGPATDDPESYRHGVLILKEGIHRKEPVLIGDGFLRFEKGRHKWDEWRVICRGRDALRDLVVGPCKPRAFEGVFRKALARVLGV